MPDDRLATLLSLLQERGPTPARQLQRTLGVSQPTLSRLVSRAGARLIRIGRARTTRYAARRNVGTLGSVWPLYRIDADGRAHLAGRLHTLAPRACWYEAGEPAPQLLHGDFADGVFPDLPWFLDDLRPQGFMGRAFARRHGDALGLGRDPQLWSADGVLSALLRYGDDTPGNFILGDAALERFERTKLAAAEPIPAAERVTRWSRLAEAALADDIPGSSAGGEQPKFTTSVEDGGSFHQLLVKFSPRRDTPGGRRWADLLVCEHLASNALRESGVGACDTGISEDGGRRYLEVRRFDRAGRHGRRGFASLMALSSAYHGELDSWIAAADRLQRDGWLNAEDADTLRLLWWFGGLIRNTDMHFGNISCALDHGRPLRLAPAYDMLPMHYRPSAAGEVVRREFVPPLPPPPHRTLWLRAVGIAVTFWERASVDSRISADFRAEAAHVLDATRELRKRYG